MIEPAPRPTLLVFTLGPTAECASRPLLPRAARGSEERLRARCLDAAVDAGQRAGCRLVVASPAPLDLPAGVEVRAQRGDSFSDRLRSAIAAAGQDGAPLVVVGSDVPGLAPDHVRRSLDLLAGEPRRAVVGPSPDGGIYLLASNAPLGDVVDGVSWCQAGTRDSLIAVLTAAGLEVVELEPLLDLDRRADLERWLARVRRGTAGAWQRVAGLLLAALAGLYRVVEAPPSAPPALAPVRLPDGRAPPRRAAR